MTPRTLQGTREAHTMVGSGGYDAQDRAAARRVHLRSLVDAGAMEAQEAWSVPLHGTSNLAPVLQSVCDIAVRLLGLSGAVVSLMTTTRSDGELSTTVAAVAGDRAQVVEEIEFSAGEGPGRDAFFDARPVLTPDVDLASGRWPAYAPAAVAAGIGASFAFPMHVGAIRLGVLHLTCSHRRSLSAEEVATCLALTEIATTTVLDAATPLDDQELERALERGPGSRDQIYQAQGMTSVDLSVSLAEALVRMRAQAFASGQDLATLSAGLLAGTTHLDRYDDEPQ